MGNQSIFEIRDVSKRFGGVTALENVSFEIQPGKVHAIVGENGAGKSTLMKILAGILTEFDGHILLRGEAIQFTGPCDAEDRGVSIIHQELNLVHQLSVAANIYLGREEHGKFGWLRQQAMDKAAEALLRRLECQVRSTDIVGSLRVGDQQLVEIAKSLSLEADVLIMDEPTSSLTEVEVERLFRVMESLRAAGTTILYISHKMSEVFRLADTITVLRDGRHVRTLPRQETSPGEVTRLMVGRELKPFDAKTHEHVGDVLLSVRNLFLPWPGHAKPWRLHDISFELRRGEVLGIAGLMGAGRTELMECLFGAQPASLSGEIRLRGSRVSWSHPRDALQAGMAMVTEDRKNLGLFAQLNVGQNISLCHLREIARSGVLRPQLERQAVTSTMEQLRIKAPGPSAVIGQLSGGNQQKCIVGRWLLTKPQVLLLDDPTRGVDVGAKEEIYELIRTLCEQGLAILLTSSELPELIALCDRMLVLREGVVTAELVRADFTEEKIMAAATGVAE